MKSIITLLSVAFIASVGFTGCCTKGSQSNCPMKNKPACSATGTSCCATSAATCPIKKKTSSQ